MNNKVSIGKEGVLAVTTNNDMHFSMAPRIKHCVHADCEAAANGERPHAAGELR